MISTPVFEFKPNGLMEFEQATMLDGMKSWSFQVQEGVFVTREDA